MTLAVPRLLMLRDEAEALLKNQIHRARAASRHELSDEAIAEAIERVDQWDYQTKELLLSMFDSPELAEEVERGGVYTKDLKTLQGRLSYVGGRITYKIRVIEDIIKRLPLYEEKVEEKQDLDIWSLIHPAIVGVAKSRFDSKHYADAVETALKHINGIVKEKVRRKCGKEIDGASLMTTAFSVNAPIIALDDIGTDTGRSIQQGYMQIFAGAMTGIRNPKAHEIVNIDEPRAIHFLFLASLLMHKLDEAI